MSLRRYSQGISAHLEQATQNFNAGLIVERSSQHFTRHEQLAGESVCLGLCWGSVFMGRLKCIVS
jgi:hypothetical protein